MGSVAPYLIWAALSRAGVAPLWSALLITGLRQHFLILSEFSLDIVLLSEQGAWQTTLACVVLSVVSRVVGTGLGVGLMRVLGQT